MIVMIKWKLVDFYNLQVFFCLTCNEGIGKLLYRV